MCQGGLYILADIDNLAFIQSSQILMSHSDGSRSRKEAITMSPTMPGRHKRPTCVRITGAIVAALMLGTLLTATTATLPAQAAVAPSSPYALPYVSGDIRLNSVSITYPTGTSCVKPGQTARVTARSTVVYEIGHIKFYLDGRYTNIVYDVVPRPSAGAPTGYADMKSQTVAGGVHTVRAVVTYWGNPLNIRSEIYYSFWVAVCGQHSPLCVDASRSVLTHSWVRTSTSERLVVTQRSSKPLCKPVYVSLVRRVCDKPGVMYPQTLNAHVRFGVLVPKTYQVTLAKAHCFRLVAYEGVGVFPRVESRLTAYATPYEAPVLHMVSTGPVAVLSSTK
jgi:hypothetical protein